MENSFNKLIYGVAFLNGYGLLKVIHMKLIILHVFAL